MKYIKIFDNLYVKMGKAKPTKYYKRVPKPTGKGYIYYYTKDQYDKSKEKEKPVKKEKKRSGIVGAWEALSNFFGITNETKFRAKIQETYSENEDKLQGVDISTFAYYMNEYLTNKDKWDKKLQGKEKVIGKDKKDRKIVKKPGDKKKKSPGEKWDLSIMRKIAGVVGDGDEGDKNAVMSSEPKKLEKKDFPDSITTTINNSKYSPLSPPPKGYTNEKTIERKIDKKNIKGGFEIFGEKFVIAKDQYGSWQSFEVNTGKSVLIGKKTIKEAIDKTVETLKKVGPEKLKEALKEPTKKPKQPEKKEEKQPEKEKSVKPKEKEFPKTTQGKYDQAKQDIIEGKNWLEDFSGYDMDNEGKFKYSGGKNLTFQEMMEDNYSISGVDLSKKGWEGKVDSDNVEDIKGAVEKHNIYLKNKKELSTLKEKLMGPKMFKAKAVPVGTVSGKYKKVGEGKWVKVTDGKVKNDKPEDKKDDKKQTKDAEKQDAKERLKNTLKKIATILADALSGKDVVQPGGQAVEEIGESSKRNKSMKPKKESKKKEPKDEKPKKG